MTKEMRAPGTDVAVVVPNYNKKKTLLACLESVYAQTHRPTEVIVVDDASSDGSPEIARAFPCTLIELPGNRGPAAARNIGVAASNAPLLFFVDSDTALAPDAISNAVRAFLETPECGVVQGIYDKEPLFDDGPVEAYRIATEYFDRWRSAGTLLSCTLIPRVVFYEAGGLDERLRDGEDYEFGTRLPARYRVVVTETVVTKADDEDRFWACWWERFVRSSTLPVIIMRARRLRGGDTVGYRLDMTGSAGDKRRRPWRISSVLATFILVMLPFLFFAPWLLPVLVLLLAGFITINRDFFLFCYQLRGTRFALFVVGMQLCYQPAFFLGFGVGLLRVVYELLRHRGNPVDTGLSPLPSAGTRK
jgi:glycosyltransferase involved in cell wall biosynthesis